MSPLRAAWDDFRDAAARFSAPARRYLLGELLAWTGHGIFQVLFNLLLVERHFQPAFIGRAISMHGIGMAVAALPAGMLAERWGRRRTLVLGALLDGLGMAVRCNLLHPGPILVSSFVSGTGQAVLAIAAAPFLTEHSSSRERTHLFSAFFANALIAGVIGSLLGGWIPTALLHMPALHLDLPGAYRIALSLGAAFALLASLPLLMLRGLREVSMRSERHANEGEARKRLGQIAFNFLLIGTGAGLVIPFMNLYFAQRFACSSAQIGVFFSIAQILTAMAALFGPFLARRFGRLRTATASQLLSLPFLVTLGAERRLPIAVGSFWMRATLMQAASPLLQAFVMDSLPQELRARSTSLNNLAWNIGWAVSATFAGLVIERFGYAMPFYVTAVMYFGAAISFYLTFRYVPEGGSGEEPPVPGEIVAD